MLPSGNGAYFQRTHWHWVVSISSLLVWFTWTVFWPETFPYDSLGPLGFVSRYLTENHYPLWYYGWWLAFSIHVAEALYSLKVCRDKGLNSVLACFLWFVQTFLFGMASLSLLLKYQQESPSKRH